MANALLDALGYIGDSLDKPGRAVRGMLGGRPEEALAAIPFSDTMGLTDPGNRVSGSDLLRQMGVDAGDGLGGTLAGMGVEMATDPLTWAGGALGGMLGRRAGAAGMARGPRYETSADDLARMVGRDVDELAPHGVQSATPISSGPFDLQDVASPSPVRSLDELSVQPMGRGYDIRPAAAPELTPEEFQIAKILGSPSRDQLLREINPAAQVLGAGAEGVAFKSPGGSVLRIGQEPFDRLGAGRPVTDDILQATRAVDFDGPLHNGGPSLMRAERTPFATGVNDPAVLTDEAMGGLRDRLGSQGIDFWDDHIGNAGMHAGRPKVIDPGAVMLDAPVAHQPVARGTRDASPLMSALIHLGGGDEAVRAAIEAGRLDPGMMLPLARLGGMGGAGVGAAGRTFEGF